MAENFAMLPLSPSPAAKPAPRWLLAVPLCTMMLVPLANLTHDLRVTLATMAVALAINAIVLRIRGLSLIVQIALWAGALASAACIFFVGAHLHG